MRRRTEEPLDGMPTRRTLLRALAGAALAGATLPAAAGCGILRRDQEPAPPDPLDRLITDTQRLVARYEAALADHPPLADRLAPIRGAHLAHIGELAQMLGEAPPDPTADPTAQATPDPPVPAEPDAVLAGLRAAEQAAQRDAAALCLAATAERAALLGSITAARAGHAEALR